MTALLSCAVAGLPAFAAPVKKTRASAKTKAAALPPSAHKEGATPLMLAAAGGKTEIVAKLLDGGADESTAPSKTGNTPLHYAVFAGQAAVCKMLLAHGADPNRVNLDGYGPLAVSVFKDHPDLAALLLDHGATVDLARKMGGTPLVMAAMLGHAPMAELLLAHGAKPDATAPRWLHAADAGRPVAAAFPSPRHYWTRARTWTTRATRARLPCSWPPSKVKPRPSSSCWNAART